MIDESLYENLKIITDSYIKVLHDLMGYHLDSLQGFKAYLDNFKKSQDISSATLNLSIKEIDKAQMIYSSGAPDDEKAMMIHECTQADLKDRLKKGGLNENLTGQFCLINMYEHWEEIRGKIADVLGVSKDDVKADIFGDLRNLRHDIIHHKGIATKEYSERNKILQWFKIEDFIVIDEKNLNTIIIEIFNFINEFVLKHTGQKIYMDNSLSQISKQRQMEHIKAGNMKVTR